VPRVEMEEIDLR